MGAAIARAGGQLVPEPLFVRCMKGLKEVRLDPGIPPVSRQPVAALGCLGQNGNTHLKMAD